MYIHINGNSLASCMVVVLFCRSACESVCIKHFCCMLFRIGSEIIRFGHTEMCVCFFLLLLHIFYRVAIFIERENCVYLLLLKTLECK